MLTFSGETRVVTLCGDMDDDAQLRAAVEWFLVDHQDVGFLGFDLEWPIGNRHVKVALVQFCDGTRCLLVRTHRVKALPEIFWKLVISARLVGVNIKADLDRLWGAFQPIARQPSAVDLSALAKTNGLYAQGMVSLQTLVETYLLKRMAKKINHQLWASTELSQEHTSYAATDAYASYAVRLVLYCCLSLCFALFVYSRVTVCVAPFVRVGYFFNCGFNPEPAKRSVILLSVSSRPLFMSMFIHRAG